MSSSEAKAATRWDKVAIENALKKRYPAPEYALFWEVRNAAGFGASRTADAVAMSTWPSRGLIISGFEVKVTRSDWLREKKKPVKAEAVSVYCDYWWLVVSDVEIVQAGELPETWGLLAPGRGDDLRVVKEPTKRTDGKPIDRSFCAVLFRAAQEQIAGGREREVRDAAFADGRKHERHVLAEKLKCFERFNKFLVEIGLDPEGWSVDYEAVRAMRAVLEDKNLLALRERVARIEQQSGVKLDDWNDWNLIEALRLVQLGGVATFRRKLEDFRNKIKKTLGEVDSALAAEKPMTEGDGG